MDTTTNPFSVSLRSYVDDLTHMTPNEHKEWIRGNRAGRPLRVFVSSRQREFAKLRLNIAVKAPHSIQYLLSEHFFPWNVTISDGIDVCEAAVDTADIFVGIYGKEYGTKSPNRSGAPIEVELNRARKSLSLDNILLFSTASSVAQPKLSDFLHRNSDIDVCPMFEDVDAATSQLVAELLPAASNNAFQPTPPLRSGSLAALGAAERGRRRH